MSSYLCFRTGFNVPLLITEKSGLGMTVPDAEFSITDVKNAVGARCVNEGDLKR